MTFTVDRIENGIVICEDADTGRTSEFSIDVMPNGIREGDIVTLVDGVYTIDVQSTQKRKAELSNRLHGLFSKGRR